MQQSSQRSVTLVLGGARSGKSRFAIEHARGFARVSFVATATPSDPEMTEKINRHKAERPSHWETIEEPLDLGRTIEVASARADLIVIDCLTIFAANLLEIEDERRSGYIQCLLATLQSPPASVVLVSNEVGSSVVPAYPSGRQFRDLLGQLNQKVAAIADTVVLLVAGLPLALKGEIGARA